MLRDLLEDIDEGFADVEARTPGSLGRVIVRMHRFYDALLKHIAHEELVLRPAVAVADAWGTARVEKMDQEHLAQKAEIRSLAALTFTSDVEAKPGGCGLHQDHRKGDGGRERGCLSEACSAMT